MANHQDDDLEQQTTISGVSDDSGNTAQIEAPLFPIDRYIPIRQLGKGALGSVYLCHDVHLVKKVAVKCLHLSTADHVISFQQEARIASRLNHDNVIKLLDFGTSKSGQPFMVMEYFEGRSLQEIIAEEGKLSNGPATEIFLQVCSALKHLHSNDVFHRDLKPSNILVNFSESEIPWIKLIDFGLSKITIQDRSGIEVQGKTIVGTPAYMSPDQVGGDNFDASSEVYSLGCVIHEIFAGQPPFVGETAIEILNKHVNETPLPLTASAPDAPAGISKIVAKCLRKDRRERYQSIAEIVDEWNEFQSTVSTIDATIVKKPAAARTGRRWRLTTILVLVLVLSTCLFGTILMVLQTVPIQSSSQIRFETLPNQTKTSLEREDAAVEGSDVLTSKKIREPAQFSRSALSPGFRLMDEMSIKSYKQTDKLLNSKADDKESITLKFFSDDQSVKKLAHRKSLQFLDVSEGTVTDAVFADLSALPKLNQLRLNGTNVKTLDGIDKLVNLQRLELKSTEINNSSLSQLKPLKNLMALSLSDTNISDAGIGNLKGHNLHELYLTSTLVTPAVAELLTNFPLVRISIAKTAVDEQAARKIAAITSIEMIDISGCAKISEADRQQLERDFPTISFDPKTAHVTELLESAGRQKEKGNDRVALAEFEQCAKMLEKRYGYHSPKLIPALLGMSSVALRLGQHEKAIKILEHAMPICEKGGTPLETLNAADQLWMAYLDIDPNKSLANATKGMRLAKNLATPIELANRYSNLGNMNLRQKRWKEAATDYQKAISMFERVNGINARELGPVSVHLGEVLREQGRRVEARNFYNKALASLGKIDAPTEFEKVSMAVAYTGLSALDCVDKNLPASLKNNDHAATYLQGTSERLALYVHHHQRAEILKQLGRTKEAQTESAIASTFQPPADKSKLKR